MPSGHTHPGIVSRRGEGTAPRLLSNQIFTVLSDRSLSHLRDLLYARHQHHAVNPTTSQSHILLSLSSVKVQSKRGPRVSPLHLICGSRKKAHMPLLQMCFGLKIGLMC